MESNNCQCDSTCFLPLKHRPDRSTLQQSMPPQSSESTAAHSHWTCTQCPNTVLAVDHAKKWSKQALIQPTTTTTTSTLHSVWSRPNRRQSDERRVGGLPTASDAIPHVSTDPIATRNHHTITIVCNTSECPNKHTSKLFSVKRYSKPYVCSSSRRKKSKVFALMPLDVSENKHNRRNTYWIKKVTQVSFHVWWPDGWRKYQLFLLWWLVRVCWCTLRCTMYPLIRQKETPVPTR